MTSTTSPLGTDFPKEIVGLFTNAIAEGTRQAAILLWDILISFLSKNWFAVLLILFVIFVSVTLKAMLCRWGSLGSFLYNFLYFSVLFIIGLIWGPQIFVDDYFNAACTVILYPVCYFVVGLILDKMKVRKGSY